MKTLGDLALALMTAGIFALALAALGVCCVVGIGMAAEACDLELTDDVAMRIERVEAQEDLQLPGGWPGPVDPDPSLSAPDFTNELVDFDLPTDEPFPPRSVPVL